MNLNYIKAFYYVAKLGSISQAARCLKLAQPTVTKKIRLLEEEMNESLIVRGARGIILTEKGKLFFTHAQKIVSQVERLEEQFSGPKVDIARIVATQGIGAYLLPQTLAKIQDNQLYPVDIQSNSGLPLEIIIDSDIYIGPFVEGLEKTHQLNHLHDFRFSFYASEEYLKRKGIPKSISDLKDHDLISFSDERRQAFEEANLSFFLTDPQFQKPFVSTKSSFSEIEMAAKGLGIALLSDIGVGHFNSGVTKLELSDFNGIETPAYAFIKKETGRDKALFIQKLFSSFQDDLKQLSL